MINNKIRHEIIYVWFHLVLNISFTCLSSELAKKIDTENYNWTITILRPIQRYVNAAKSLTRFITYPITLGLFQLCLKFKSFPTLGKPTTRSQWGWSQQGSLRPQWFVFVTKLETGLPSDQRESQRRIQEVLIEGQNFTQYSPTSLLRTLKGQSKGPHYRGVRFIEITTMTCDFHKCHVQTHAPKWNE